MIEYIEKAIELVSERNQFKTPNLLTEEIQHAIIINQEQAIETAEGLCKVLTFWIEAYSKELIDFSFTEYYKLCIDKGYIVQSQSGLYTWMALSLDDFADRFDIEISEIGSFRKFCNYKKNDEFLGTLRIKSKSGGLHSLVAFRNQAGQLKIADTSSRGIDVDLHKHINENNFKYFTEMIV